MSYENALIENYRAVRRRLIGAPVFVRLEPPPVPEMEPEPRERDYLYIEPILRPRCRVIADEVCAKHGVTFLQLKGEQRNKQVSSARHELFYRLSRETTMSMAGIGRMVGGKDHTSVIHGIRRHQERMASA